MSADIELTADLLRAVLDYEPTTGLLRWRADCGSAKRGDVAGSVGSKGYVQVGFARRSYAAHRLAWLYVHDRWPTFVVDHINGDRTDNRIANLRDVTQLVNLQNQRRASGKNKTTGLLGVWLSPGCRRFVSRITVAGRRIHLGYFDTPEAGHQAYVEAKRKLHEGCTL